MSLQSDLAFSHQHARELLAHALSARTVGLWRNISISNLDANWDTIAPLMVRQIVSAQLVAAQQTTPYLNSIDESYGLTPKPASLVAEAFTNVMGDGREIAPALYGAVTNTKTLIGKGVAPLRAFESGAHFIALVTQAALIDMGRNADRVLSSGKGYTQYIRVVNGSACSRCAILAGIYSSAEAFKRHVSCQCGVVPIEPKRGAKIPDGFHTSPKAYFDSLSKAEQDRVFTNDGAEAIRAGADPAKVVNARRGAYGIAGNKDTVPQSGRRLEKVTVGRKADGSPLQVYATNEGRFRGNFRKAEDARGAAAAQAGRYTRTTTLRLMPEQIRIMAGNDFDRYVELLGRYGYLE